MSRKGSLTRPENRQEIRTDHITYDWQVSSAELLRDGDSCSRIFGEIACVEWRMCISTLENAKSGKSDVRLKLFVRCSNAVQIYATYNFLLRGKDYKDNAFQGVFLNGESISFIFPETALYEEVDGILQFSDSPIIRLNLRQELSYAKFYEPSLNSLHFSELLDSEEFSDTTIETDDGTKIPVQRVLLRSPIFCNMMGETTKCIKMKGFSSETIRHLIRYIYTGTMPTFRCTPTADLLRAADTYGIPDLQTICSENLSLNLTVGNATQLLLLADRHGDASLRVKALQYISENRLNFKDPSVFDVAKHSQDLLMEIICAFTENLNISSKKWEFSSSFRSTSDI